MRGYNTFLHITVQARGASLSFKELCGHPTFHKQAREARVWVEVEDEAHRQGHQGSRGVSTPSHRRLSQQISQLYRVRFCYLAYGLECYLILVLRIHSLLHQLGLEVETLEEPLYVSSSLGIRARIGMICRGCELEISGTLLTVDLRIMDMSEFDVILGMDWLTSYRVVIDCERRRVTAYMQDGTRVVFEGDKHDILPQIVYESRCQGQLAGWLASLTLEDEERPNLDLPRVVCEYVDVFPDELPGLPPQRVVDFGIELHPGTSPISMTPHRMAPVELQELRVQL